MILGADPEQLDSLAQRISGRADAYDHAHQQISFWLNRLTWQGPEAHRFRSAYRSSMGPQLVHAAAAMRDAASSLRSQAAHQRDTSSGRSAIGPRTGMLDSRSGGARPDPRTVVAVLERAKTWAEFERRMLEFGLTALEAFKKLELFRGIQDLPKSFMVSAKVLGGLGAIYSVATFKGELSELSDDLQDFDWSDQDSIEQFFYSGTDILISAGAILGVTPLAPAGLALMSTGYVMKAGTAVLPDLVNRAVDDVVWPAWEFVKNPTRTNLFALPLGRQLHDAGNFAVNRLPRMAGDVVDGVGAVAGGVVGGVVDGVGDLAEDAGNVIRDMGETSANWVKGGVDVLANNVKSLFGW